MNYGILNEVDVLQLESAMLHARTQFNPVIFLEIGVCHGDTARGIRDFLGKDLVYYGIDSGRDRPIEVPFDGANLIIGDSSEVYNSTPHGISILFIDGCHCINHVMLDFLHYFPKVSRGGYIIFHDTNPKSQGTEYQGHGPRNNPDFNIAVLKAVGKLRLMDDYNLITSGNVYEPKDNSGGTITFKRWK